jgi:hypothetical protein
VRESQFLSRLRLERVLGKDEWYLLEPLRYYSAGLRRIIHVDPGFPTDFASIPRLFWRIFPKNGAYDGAAVLHDAGYRGAINLTRKETDDLFYEAMRVLGIGSFKARSMWLAVRLFGGGAYVGPAAENANQ